MQITSCSCALAVVEVGKSTSCSCALAVVEDERFTGGIRPRFDKPWDTIDPTASGIVGITTSSISSSLPSATMLHN